MAELRQYRSFNGKTRRFSIAKTTTGRNKLTGPHLCTIPASGKKSFTYAWHRAACKCK